MIFFISWLHSGIIILFTCVTLNAQELAVTEKATNKNEAALHSALVDLEDFEKRQIIDAILNKSKVEDDEVAMVNSLINKKEANPINLSNAYQGDDSIKIPNHYDPEKDISIRLPNANLEGINEKRTILKLNP
ncbi:hypothetical protein [Albibacterium profundi]|uniref:Uncharacterized protein n=1 Tax=Albibacterium profundi TaxID=3134906 RepID=A0ABV5CGB6_9SPHI